jgi:hypothetical protein
MTPINPQSPLGVLNAGQAVNIAGTGLSIDQLMGELGLNQAQVNQQVAQATQGLGYTEAQAGIGQEQLGLQGQGLEAQKQLLGTQFGIQGQTLAGQEQLAATQYGLTQQEEAAQQQAQQVAYGNQQAATQGQIATSGAVGSVGAQRQVATQGFENQQAQAALQRQATGAQAQYGFQQEQFGLEAKGQAAQQAYSMGDIARGESGLNLASQANGLTLDQTINQVGYGMTQAGLQGQQNAEQLYGQLGAAVGQGATYQAGAIGYGALLGGVNLNSALSGGG